MGDDGLMPQPAPTRPRTGRPPRLSQQEIISTARRIIDDDGLLNLTMRRLAREIGSTPMALYHHVKDKEDLLVLLLDDYTQQIPHPELPTAPRERIIATGIAMHDALKDCTWIVEVLTTDSLLSTSGLWYAENIIDASVDAGLDPEQAVHAYRTIWYYTAGEILVRANSNRRRQDTEGPTYRDRVFATLDPQSMPRLASLADRWSVLTSQDTYRQGLQAIVNGLIGWA